MTFSLFNTRLRRASWIGVSLGTALLVGCASIPGGIRQQAPSTDRHELSASSGTLSGDSMPAARTSAGTAPSPSAPTDTAASELASQPELIRQANLTVVLTELDLAADTVQQIIDRAQGSLLGLQDHRSLQGEAQQILITLRVPYHRLDSVLSDIRDLGTVQQQSITVEDVSDQLVDLDARLKNLRKSEAALLDIMERSGDIADVLEVSRELSHVRESIERLAAQQQNLERRVAYSYIYLTLKSPTTAVTPLRPAGETLGHTWQTATRSMKAFTIGGLKVSLWLLAYSPYLVFLAFLGLGGYRLWHPHAVTTPAGEGDPGQPSE